MKTPRKHAELIKAWADGAEIQLRMNSAHWVDCVDPYWSENIEYRVKPEPKPDVVLYRVIDLSFRPTNESPNGFCSVGCWPERKSNIKLTFDGETGKLKSAEVL